MFVFVVVLSVAHYKCFVLLSKCKCVFLSNTLPVWMSCCPYAYESMIHKSYANRKLEVVKIKYDENFDFRDIPKIELVKTK